MLAIDNPTGLPAALVPGLDEEGRTVATVVLKATFRLREGELALADEQAPIRLVDEHTGHDGADDPTASLRYEADLAPQKAGTDVILIGHAWSPSPVTELDVTLTAGPLKKVVRVFGDRAFYADGVSAPRPFARMPLTWELAYGGADGEEFEPRNPVGTGFLAAADGADGVRLPNLEDPRRLIARPEDRPAPAGFGHVARHWMPRRAFAGTYDEAWRADRFPLLPRDFDRRFHQSAAADLIAPRCFAGGEPVRVEGASEGGPIAFRVPRMGLAIDVAIKRITSAHRPALDTLVIEPDERRVTLTYRVTFGCPRGYLPLDGVTIRRLSEAA